MSIETLVWAMNLTAVSPVAKLVAIKTLDGKNDAALQHFALSDLANFACCSTADVGAALVELMCGHGFLVKYLADGNVFVDREFEPVERVVTYRPRERGSCFIYIIGAVGRIKIGTAQDPKGRFQTLQTGFPDPIDKHLLI
jgi:hypothetical protein